MKHNCPKNTVKLRPLAVTGARFVVSFAVLAGALALTACATGDVPTPEEIKQDNTESRARQLVRVGDASRAGGDAVGRFAARPAQSLREAYSRGAAGAWTATGGSPVAASAPSAAPAAQPPAWANRMQSEQRLQQAGQAAAHSLSDGDRGSSGAAPSLQDKDE